ncbi:hypothetical protein H6F93_31945 [Leptolyngbya sp. FACHB-671]|nr:hypothetical protein [Leptolyngbya sp. FACHB-671]MBD2072082.1 hypothetical protein [Leptolyngbya sp. FACHB-671]
MTHQFYARISAGCLATILLLIGIAYVKTSPFGDLINDRLEAARERQDG